MTSIADVLGGRYRIDRLLGRGGMSDVYEATDLVGGARVALKLVRSGDPDFARRLAREAAVLESFDHPGLIRLLDIGAVDDQAFLVMELVDGPTLARALERGPLGSRESAALGARLADALDYVHRRGVVHRDVKPSNILMGVGGAKLGDFGIAAQADASSYTVTGTTLGTVSYMAPEQLENHQVGASADVWSLGVVLLECLTGRRAYAGSPSEVMARRLAGPVPLPADLPPPWRQVLNGMLERDPAQRLTAGHATALLATSAFDAPWTPLEDDATTRLAPPEANDRTSVIPGFIAPPELSGDATRVVPPSRTVPSARPRHWWRLALLGALVVAVVWAGVAFALGAGPTSPTTTSTSSTTSTVATSSSAATTALATLVSDVTSATHVGILDPTTGTSIDHGAGAAVTAYGTGQTPLAASDLQQTAATIAAAGASGLTTPGEAAVLQGDLLRLATALQLASSVTTTTTAPVPIAPGPGHGNGKGHGQ